MLEVLVSGWMIGIAIALPVGPVITELIRRGLQGGFLQAWLVGLGAAAAHLILVTLTLLGVVALLDRPIWHTLLGTGGMASVWSATNVFTEREFAIALEFGMRELGASGNSFDPIIASGPNGSKPHAIPSDRVIGRNELVVCDFGCIVDGYCSDMTRTVFVGSPRPEQQQLFVDAAPVIHDLEERRIIGVE